jgi:hypothetical protein
VPPPDQRELLAKVHGLLVDAEAAFPPTDQLELFLHPDDRVDLRAIGGFGVPVSRSRGVRQGEAIVVNWTRQGMHPPQWWTQIAQ